MRSREAAPLITLYHVDGTRCERIIWLMEELELPYELNFKSGDIEAGINAIAAIHPLRMAPTVTIGDEVMAESAFIIEYILDQYGAGSLVPPKGSNEYWEYRYFMHFSEATAAPRTIAAWFDSLGQPSELYQEDADSSSAATAARLQHVITLLEERLKGRSYLTGQTFSAADIMMYLPIRQARLSLENAERRASGTKERVRFIAEPNLDAYYQRLLERAAFVRAFAKANPYGPRQGLEP
jgi:glutathione S-transferase